MTASRPPHASGSLEVGGVAIAIHTPSSKAKVARTTFLRLRDDAFVESPRAALGALRNLRREGYEAELEGQSMYDALFHAGGKFDDLEIWGVVSTGRTPDLMLTHGVTCLFDEAMRCKYCRTMIAEAFRFEGEGDLCDALVDERLLLGETDSTHALLSLDLSGDTLRLRGRCSDSEITVAALLRTTVGRQLLADHCDGLLRKVEARSLEGDDAEDFRSIREQLCQARDKVKGCSSVQRRRPARGCFSWVGSKGPSSGR
ncbi:uncharacterized protein LTR77_010974 [Saxophila tyrrhenica]|uniref:Uncharacterized protein n=1 Tax=Saxophila tyrrhenica TaxID=1690608 RepID=A0AAV9NU33_9PEZI|nr:hypothetical protein LTR77_010974 [Saxophila tyrrhenica]